jgi:hypothetical protein
MTDYSTSLQHLLRLADVLACTLTIGAPVWVFFLQGPALFRHMGRDRFLSPMMKLTSVLFRWTLPSAAVLSLLCTVTALATKKNDEECSRDPVSILLTPTSLTSLFALTYISVNSFVVIPAALQAGKRAMVNNKKNEDHGRQSSIELSEFTIKGGEGGPKSGTKTLHQFVVVFVTLHLIASVLHLHYVLKDDWLYCR